MAAGGMTGVERARASRERQAHAAPLPVPFGTQTANPRMLPRAKLALRRLYVSLAGGLLVAVGRTAALLTRRSAAMDEPQRILVLRFG